MRTIDHRLSGWTQAPLPPLPFLRYQDMHAEEQIGHPMREDARPEAVRLVEEEVIDSTSHHPREPESMFAAEEHHRDHKGDAGKRPETDGGEPRGHTWLTFRKQHNHKARSEGPLEQSLHHRHNACRLEQPYCRQPCPNTSAGLQRIIPDSLLYRCPGTTARASVSLSVT
jgi:hypothetical protein